MALMKYPQRKKLATEWERYCAVAKVEPTIPRFIEWLENVKGIWLMSQVDRQAMVREAVELERIGANAASTAARECRKEPEPLTDITSLPSSTGGGAQT